MYEDRSYTYGENKVRIDAVVRGLLGAGVRAGEHVGVLMGTRPSALAVVTALNRIGAIAVMLRPGADTAREVELGTVNRVIARFALFALSSLALIALILHAAIPIFDLH